MHPVGHSRDQVAQEVAGNAPGGFLVQFRKGKLTRAVDGYKEVELALLRPHLGDVDVEVADRIRLEPLLRACRPRARAGARCRDAASSDADWSASGAGSWAGARRGSHPAEKVCAAERRQSRLPLPRSARSIAALSVRSADRLPRALEPAHMANLRHKVTAVRSATPRRA